MFSEGARKGHDEMTTRHAREFRLSHGRSIGVVFAALRSLFLSNGFRLGTILLLGLLLRVFALGRFSYSFDEAYVLLMSQNLADVLSHGTLVYTRSPLIATLVAFWRLTGMGVNEWTTRLLPVLLAMFSIVAFYCLVKSAFDTRTALWAAFLLAIAPVHILHARELKEVPLVSFTVILATHFLIRAMVDNGRREWVMYGFAAALSCYASVFAGPLLFAVNMWAIGILCYRRSRFSGWILSNALAVALLLPLLGITLRNAGKFLMETTGWPLPKPTFWSVVFYFKTITFGYSDLKPHFKISLCIFAVFSIIGIVLSLRQNKRVGWLLVVWLAVPLALLYVQSQILPSTFLFRRMLIYSFPVYVWVALGITRLRSRLVCSCLVLCFVALAVFPLTQMYRGEYPVKEFPHRPWVHGPLPFKEAAEFVSHQAQEGDIIVHSSFLAQLSWHVYGLDGYSQYTVCAEEDLKDWFDGMAPEFPMTKEVENCRMRLIQDVIKDQNRVWFVFSEWEREFYINNPRKVWEWLDKRYAEILHEDFQGFEVFLYVKDVNGGPLLARSRDVDDGVTAQITYAGPVDIVYKKTMPDTGLVLTAPTERRGPLTLQFIEEEIAENGRASHQSSRSLSFGLRNRSQESIQCLVEVVSPKLTNGMASPWPASIIIPPLGERRWNVEPAPGTARLDIWASEQGEDERTYHVFQMLDTSKPEVPYMGLVLIVVDTLRADRLGRYRGDVSLMPNIGRFAETSWHFTNAISQASWTKPAMASIFTSLYPEVHQVQFGGIDQPLFEGQNMRLDVLSASIDTFASHLSKSGFNTAAIQTNLLLKGRYGFAQGFDSYEFLDPNTRADKVTDYTLEKLATLEPPFFLYVHYMDPHEPYDPPDKFKNELGPPPQITETDASLIQNPNGLVEYILRKKNLLHDPEMQGFSESGRELLRYLYDGEVRFADEEVGRLISYIKTHYPGCAIVFTADHGEEFWEHDFVGHGATVYQEVIRVPLVMYFPDAKPRRIDAPVETIDILPTVNARFGFLTNPDWQGQNIEGYFAPDAPTNRPQFSRTTAAFTELDTELSSVISGMQKLIVDEKRSEMALYDLTHDPGERSRSESIYPGSFKELQAMHLEHQRQNAAHPKNTGKTPTIEIRKETSERLRALGYY